MYVARCGLHQAQGRRDVSGPFAALNRNEAVELEQLEFKGNLNGKGGAVRREQGLVSSMGTPAQTSLTSFQDWYMADKQLVVISLSAFVVCFFSLQQCTT